jgi:predicted HTH transcriptional regulator
MTALEPSVQARREFLAGTTYSSPADRIAAGEATVEEWCAVLTEKRGVAEPGALSHPVGKRIREAILRALTEAGPLSSRAVAARAGTTRSTTANTLCELQRAGLLRAIKHHGNNRVYALTENTP